MISVTAFIKQSRILSTSKGQLLVDMKNIVRNTLRAMIFLWASRYLPKHFEISSKFRYKFRPRGRGYKRLKEIIALTRQMNASVWDAEKNRFARSTVRAPSDINPNLDWVFTGTARKNILGRPASYYSQSAKVTATRTRQRAEVRLPVGHPYNPQNLGELTRPFNKFGQTSSNPDEVNALVKYGKEIMTLLLKQYWNSPGHAVKVGK